MRKALYVGSFDPITKGHMDIIEQATKIFDIVTVAILNNGAKKNPMFTPVERYEMIRELYQDTPNVKVIVSSGAAVDVAIDNECYTIVRGARNGKDFDDESTLANINREISDGTVNTVCLFANPLFQYVSSTMVKEVFGLNKNIDRYVHPVVKDKMLAKRTNQT